MTRQLSLVVLFAFNAISSACSAALLLDQSNIVQAPAGLNSTLWADSSLESAQVVKTGIAGQLVQLDLGLFRGAELQEPLRLDIVKVYGGVPDFSPASRLVTREVNSLQLPLLLTYQSRSTPEFTIGLDLSNESLHFEVDESFGIVMRSAAHGYYWWSYFGTEQYSRGAAYAHVVSQSVRVAPGFDGHFRTIVNDGVPEPSSAAAIASGLVVLASCVRHRKQTT